MDIVSWTTLTGPAKLPPEIVTRLSELSKKAIESEDFEGEVRRSRDDAVVEIRLPIRWAYRDAEEARLAPIIPCRSGARVD